MYLQQKTKRHAFQELIHLLFTSSAAFILGGQRPFRFASHLRSLVGVCNARRIRRRNAQSIIVTRIAVTHIGLANNCELSVAGAIEPGIYAHARPAVISVVPCFELVYSVVSRVLVVWKATL